MKPTLTAAAALTTSLTASAAPASADQALSDWIAKVKDKDDKVRGPAWQNAANYGAPAVPALIPVMSDPDFEIARAAKRALWKIVRHAGRPEASDEAETVAARLVDSLDAAPTAVRRELLWMLSEIGGDSAIPAIAALLTQRDTREDARATLERIPGTKALQALKAALPAAAEEFKPAIAHSLRVRGVQVEGYPSQKLVPTRPAVTTG